MTYNVFGGTLNLAQSNPVSHRVCIVLQAEASRKYSQEKTPTISTTDAEKKPATTEEDDYKAKLAENRRLAREKAERESAEEKARAEERRYVTSQQL